MRDVANRYQGLPPRSPEMLFLIVRKFYRGAVSHYDLIQEKQRDVTRALTVLEETGDRTPLIQALRVLFNEFHFYVTCWLQIDLALYRLCQHEQTKDIRAISEHFQEAIQRHLQVRAQLDDLDACVERQFVLGLDRLRDEQYWFDGFLFCVDQTSLQSLHNLYQAIMAQRPN